MILNAAALANLTTGFKAAFNTGFRSNLEIHWAKVATLVPSTTKTETYAWLGQFPRLREWLGDRQVKNLSQSSYTITNKKFESTIAVKRDDLDDDQYGVYSPLFQELGYSAATHPDELVFTLLAAGFATPCFDGQYFFDPNHPVAGGVVSNLGAGAGTPWFLLDTSRSLKPLIFQKRRDYKLTSLVNLEDPNVFLRDEYLYGVDARCNVGFGFWQMAYGSKAVLDAAGFNAAYAAMLAQKSDDGRPLGIRPTLLVVPPSLRDAANAVIKAERTANGATNTNQNAVDILICPWL